MKPVPTIPEPPSENKFLYSPWPDPKLIREPATDNAQAQADLDAFYSDPKIAAKAGTGKGLPAIGPGKLTFTYSEILTWLRSRVSLRRRAARVVRYHRRQRESATRSRDEIRESRAYEATTGPPRKTKGRARQGAPENSLDPSTSRPYACSHTRANPSTPSTWISLGDAVRRVLLRLGGGGTP